MMGLSNLQPRERRMVLIGLVAAVVAGIYALVLEPFLEAHEQAGVRVEAQQSLLEHLRQTSRDVKQLRQHSTTQRARPKHQSILALIDRTSRKAGIKKSMKRLTPEGEKKVRLWVEEAPFDLMISWLAELTRNNGVVITDISVSPEEKPGLARANMTLTIPN